MSTETVAGSSVDAMHARTATAVQVISTNTSPRDAVSGGTLQEFEGFLKAAGHAAGLVLADVVKYALPIATVVSVAVPPGSAAEQAFAASLTMVLNTVIVVEQKWSALGSADAQKLADVLQIVEQPMVTLFAQAGFAVDALYVTDLVNAVVALLNAQPAVIFPLMQAA